MSGSTATGHEHVWVPIELAQVATAGGTAHTGYLYLACACGAYTAKSAFYVQTEIR